MSETNQITVKMYGIEATGSPSQIAELKKLLDEQNPIKIKFIPQTQPYPWYQQPYIQPYIYTQPNYKTGTPPWSDLTITCNSLSTSNDTPVLGNDGNIIKYNLSTYTN